MSIDRVFNRLALSEIKQRVRQLEPDVIFRKANVYIQSGKGKRWFTFDYEGFHYEGWKHSKDEGLVDAWDRYLTHKGHEE
jgi:hypothetical protein